MIDDDDPVDDDEGGSDEDTIDESDDGSEESDESDDSDDQASEDEEPSEEEGESDGDESDEGLRYLEDDASEEDERAADETDERSSGDDERTQWGSSAEDERETDETSEDDVEQDEEDDGERTEYQADDAEEEATDGERTEYQADESEDEADERAEYAADDDERGSEEASDWDDDVEYGLELDDDVRGTREQFADAEDDDFEDDEGDWSDDDYEESAQRFFGRGDFFGDTFENQARDQGYEPIEQEWEWRQAFDQAQPGVGRTVRFFARDGAVSPLGFVSREALSLLQQMYPQVDLTRLHVTVPPRPRTTPLTMPVEELPPELRAVPAADKVDLRKFCSPVGDQGQTSRCTAFTYTHAIEMLGNMAGQPTPRLSCSYTMLQFQRRQGDVRDHQWAYLGGDGTESGPLPGQSLIEGGTCRHDLWPDDSERPCADDDALAQDAASHRLQAKVCECGVEDLRRLLSAGCPIEVGMNTGESFSKIGRDGLFHAAEKPSGDHGRHSMLIVGYVGNYFILKNSWGADWGDQGYCYVPKKVLADSDPELIAIVPTRARAKASGSGGGGPSSKPRPHVPCTFCSRQGPAGATCQNCGATLPRPPKPPSVPPPAPVIAQVSPSHAWPQQHGYAPPAQGHSFPAQAYAPPAQGHSFPAQAYAPPPQSHSFPAQAWGGPRPCPGCGLALPAHARFCNGCGARIAP